MAFDFLSDIVDVWKNSLSPIKLIHSYQDKTSIKNLVPSKCIGTDKSLSNKKGFFIIVILILFHFFCNSFLFISDIKRSRHPQQSINLLRKWFEKYSNDAYPSKETKEFLAKKSNLTIQQVSNWFLNERKKQRKTKKYENNGKRGKIKSK